MGTRHCSSGRRQGPSRCDVDLSQRADTTRGVGELQTVATPACVGDTATTLCWHSGAMHIGFQRSGGRGEYEVVGSHSGYNAISLQGWNFNVQGPDGVIRDTGLELEPAQSGKPRLRSTWAAKFQIGRMMAAMLMLPDPCRDFRTVGAGAPVARHKNYILTRVGFSPDTQFSGIADLVTVDPSFIDIENEDSKETLGVAYRWKRILRIYDRLDEFPSALWAPLNDHYQFLTSGQPITGELTQIVREVQRQSGRLGGIQDYDPLELLERNLQLPAIAEVPLPSPDEIGEEEFAVSARAAHEYRLAKARGYAARKFSSDVLNAYGYRCAFCGAKLGGFKNVLPGIDAAHILAWTKYDLDVVRNGIALCKLHHWAFDSAMLIPSYVDHSGKYEVRPTELIRLLDEHSIRRLGPVSQMLQEPWLPTSADLRPQPQYLEVLHADLAVEFLNE